MYIKRNSVCNIRSTISKMQIKIGIVIYLILFIKDFLFCYPANLFQISSGSIKQISIREELCIGELQNNIKSIFNDIIDIKVDSDANIYVLDAKDKNIKIFNKNGEFLRIVGRPGQGPGEFGFPDTIQIINDNQIVVSDTIKRCLIYFSLNGEYQKMDSLKSFRFFDLEIDSKGNLYFMNEIMSAEQDEFQLLRLDAQTKKTKLIAQMAASAFNEPVNMDIGILFKVLPNDCLVYGHPIDDYEMVICNPEGVPIKKIIKDFKPLALNLEDKERFQKIVNMTNLKNRKINYRKYFAPFQKILCDDLGQIITQTPYHYPINPYDVIGIEYDVFSSGGEYLYKFKLPRKSTHLIFSKGKIYSVEENEEGFHVIRRYSCNIVSQDADR